ncbi:hypothetical protein DYGSA30_08990 [Dyella sp. GSA-30]|nr:hypothetical protein DYGSA30_08990 [Dyella sp. GSA-30]
MLPTIVFDMVADRLEAPLRIGGGAPAFEGARRLVHGLSVRARGLTGGDMPCPIRVDEIIEIIDITISCDGSFKGAGA